LQFAVPGHFFETGIPVLAPGLRGIWNFWPIIWKITYFYAIFHPLFIFSWKNKKKLITNIGTLIDSLFFINNQLYSVLKYPLKKINMSTLSSCRDDQILVIVLPHPAKNTFCIQALGGIELKISKQKSVSSETMSDMNFRKLIWNNSIIKHRQHSGYGSIWLIISLIDKDFLIHLIQNPSWL
jgi:hypothetical protein